MAMGANKSAPRLPLHDMVQVEGQPLLLPFVHVLMRCLVDVQVHMSYVLGRG